MISARVEIESKILPSTSLPAVSGRNGMVIIPQIPAAQMPEIRLSLSGWFVWENLKNSTSLPFPQTHLWSRCQMVNFRLYFSFSIHSEILWPWFHIHRGKSVSKEAWKLLRGLNVSPVTPWDTSRGKCIFLIYSFFLSMGATGYII